MASALSTLFSTVTDLAGNIDRNQVQQFTGHRIDSVDEFMRKTEHTGPKNYGRGFLAGVLGGLAGAAVKMIVDRNLAPGMKQFEDNISEDIVDAGERATGITLSEEDQDAAEAIVEVGIACLIGGVYGLIVEAMPEAKTDARAASGGGVFATAQQLAMPALGILPAAVEDVAVDKVQNIAGHVAFGATCEVVRRAARYYMEE